MSDRSIRDLELRAARDPGAALELAHALERVGRPADALAALWSGCSDLGVRRATAGIASTWPLHDRDVRMTSIGAYSRSP